MSKHSPSKRMKDKEEEKVEVQEEEEENIVQNMNQHLYQGGDTPKEEVEVKIR